MKRACKKFMGLKKRIEENPAAAAIPKTCVRLTCKVRGQKQSHAVVVNYPDFGSL